MSVLTFEAFQGATRELAAPERAEAFGALSGHDQHSCWNELAAACARRLEAERLEAELHDRSGVPEPAPTCGVAQAAITATVVQLRPRRASPGERAA